MSAQPIEMQLSTYRACFATGQDSENYALVKVTVPKDANVGETRAEMVLVLDCSASMDEIPRNSESRRSPKNAVIDAVQEIINVLRPNDRLGIVAFDDTAWLAAPLTAGENRQKLRDAMERLRNEGGGSTSLKPALELAVKEIRQNARDAKAARLVVLTDGQAGDAAATLGYIRTLERQSIASLGFGDFDFNFMNEVCKPSQGLCQEVGKESPSKVKDVFLDELRVAQNTVASNVRLRIRPTDIGKLVKSYIVHPNPTFLGPAELGAARELVINLPVLDRTEGIEVLLHMRHPSREMGNVSAGEVTLLYDVPSLNLQNQELVDNIEIEYVNREDRRLRDSNLYIQAAFKRGFDEEVRQRYEKAVGEGDAIAADRALGTLMKSDNAAVAATATKLKTGGASANDSKALTQSTRKKQSS